MSAPQPQRLDYLAEELTRRLGIPFYPAARAIVFRDRLRITDWAVPLMFDGHARRDDESVIPADFVGHALWPALRPFSNGPGRTWWYCNLSPVAAEAIVATLQEEDEYPLDEGWVIGHDVLLDEAFADDLGHADRWVA
ncbi:MAG: hypothetical protein ACRD12_18715 [Acidimicrobiales bacterium]